MRCSRGRLFNVFSLWGLSFIVAIILPGCSSKPEIKNPAETWDAFVEAVTSGDSEAAEALFALESLPYFTLDSAQIAEYAESQFTIIKTETYGRFIKLHILQKRDGRQTALFKYLIQRNDTYLFQYPFLIFPSDWPTKESPHFTIHSEAFDPLRQFQDSEQDSMAYDPERLEQYLAQIKSLTGSDFDRRIDYYYCRNEDQVELLSGKKNVLWQTQGPCVISSKKYDLAEITRIVTGDFPRPCDILYFGIFGYSELERARVTNAPVKAVYQTTAKYTRLLKDHSLVDYSVGSDSAEGLTRENILFFAGGALVKSLIDDYGPAQFNRLYQASPTTEEFEKQITLIYNTDVRTLENKLGE